MNGEIREGKERKGRFFLVAAGVNSGIQFHRDAKTTGCKSDGV